MSEEKKDTEKKELDLTDEEILFPEIEVDGVVVKPWSFGKLFKVSNKLEKIINRVESSKLDRILSKDFITYSELASLFTTVVSKEILDVIAVTLDMPIEEVETFDMDTGIKISIVIFQQNKKTIKNALAPLFGMMEMKKKVIEEENE